MMQIETWWNAKSSLSIDHKMFPYVNENISQTTRDQKIIAIEEIQTFVLNFNFFHSDRLSMIEHILYSRFSFLSPFFAYSYDCLLASTKVYKFFKWE